MLDFKLMELFGDGRVTAWGVYGFRVVPHVGEHIEVQRAGQAQVYVVRAVVQRPPHHQKDHQRCGEAEEDA